MEGSSGVRRTLVRTVLRNVQCGLAFFLSGGVTAHAQSINPAVEVAKLQPYSFSDAAMPAASGASIADLILGVDGLRGTATVTRAQREVKCARGVAARNERLRCLLLRELGDLLRAANSDAIPPKLDTLSSWILAGRYDMGARFDGLAQERGGRHFEDIRQQLGLGSIDFVQEAFATLDRRQLKARTSKVVFVDGGGSFAFAQGAITIDTLGIKRLIVADFLSTRRGFVRLSDCLSQHVIDVPAKVFCHNLLERARVSENSDAAHFRPPGPSGDPVIGAGGTVGDLIGAWRDWYGLSYVEAYFDETWNYLAALSARAAGRHGIARCEADCAQGAAAYIAEAREGLLRQLTFVLAHELSHQLLGHAEQPGPAGGGEDERCQHLLSMETQADVFGALLTRRVVVRQGGDAYETWAPFFDGYVALFESRRSRCGYFSGQARHILFVVLYTDRNWAD